MSHHLAALVDRVQLVDIPPTMWPACKNVLRCIASHANESEANLAWPGVPLMMLETGCSESTISRATELLADSGWITKKRRFARSNMYRVNATKLRAHQVILPDAYPTYMSEHLDGMLFPGETDPRSTVQDIPQQRSTARSRAAKRAAKQRADQGTRQIDGTVPSNRRDNHVDLPTQPRQIDEQNQKEPAGNQPPNQDGSVGTSPGKTLLGSLPAPWTLDAAGIKREAPHVDALLMSGWTVPELITRWTHNRRELRNPPGALRYRIRHTEPKHEPAAAAEPWCGAVGECDEQTRQRENPAGKPYRCPECHPLRGERTQQPYSPGPGGR